MTPQQIAAELAAKRTDAPTRYALNGTPLDLRALVARTFHAVTHASAVDAQIVARSTEDPVMPAEVEARITAVLKEIRDAH